VRSRVGPHGGQSTLDGFTLGMTAAGFGMVVGIGGSYTNGRLSLDGLDEHTSFAAPRGLAYIGYARPHWSVNSGASVAHTMYDMTRSFAFTAFAPTGKPLFGGVERTATSSPLVWPASSGEKWRVVCDARLVGSCATAGVHYARYGVQAWSESGADALSLTAPAQSTISVQADGGLRYRVSAGGSSVGSYRLPA